MDEEYKKALERVEMLEKELARIKQAIINLSEGKLTSEYMNFDKSAFLEENEIRKKSYSALAHMMDGLMEIKYCTYYIVCEGLEKEFEEYREEVRINTGWGMGRKDTYMIAYLLNELQDIYEAGVKRYKKVSKYYPERADRSQFVPEYCPWSLKELINSTVDELLEKLPSKEMVG